MKEPPIYKEDLKKRAFLNSLTSVVDYVAKLGVGFFINPIMVSLLGPIYYGAWQVIGQLNSYMATADIRAATSLKFILSRDRSVKHDKELKEAVSSGLYANAFFIPIYLLLGIFITWFAPILAGVEKSYFFPVRVAAALLVISFIVTQFFFLFESTLHGMNLSYKRIGIRAAITIFGGGATASVLYLGYGIIGMAVIQILIATATGLSFWWIVKKNVAWFEFLKVKTQKVINFIKLSGWYMLLKFSDLLSQSIDMILLGYLAGPKYVAAYAITKYLMTATSGLVRTVTNASAIGIAKFIGERNYKKLLETRKQLISVQWFLIIIGGSLVVLFNETFVGLWTEENLFAGQKETLFIVLIALVTVLYQIDSSIINSTLNVRRKIVYTLISSIIIIGLSFFLVPLYKTTGLLISIFSGVLFLSFSNSFLVKQLTSDNNVISHLYFSRIAFVGAVTIAGCNFLAKYISIHTWFLFFASAFVAALILTGFTWFIAMNRNQRKLIYTTIKHIKN